MTNVDGDGNDDVDTDADINVDADADAIARAADAVRRGDLVVYPTETVYGLGADALDPDAVARVFELKGRAREKPLSLAVPDVAAALAYTEPSPRERRFLRAFLPGPVTVVLEAHEQVPGVLTAGRERVGIRVPDHPLARALLRRVAPLTATSANRSGNPSARRVAEVDPAVRDGSTVLDGGETSGKESTVVDVSTETIHRRGARAAAVAAWLADEEGR
ncbi:threonylcarbamoyl-AMP synthase [Halobacteriales archaeon QS_4_69_34]|nr:MAG: threonylcarbamoyl-AMP synthase [Halobacteriales archaeon QS_4_69_34]